MNIDFDRVLCVLLLVILNRFVNVSVMLDESSSVEPMPSKHSFVFLKDTTQ